MTLSLFPFKRTVAAAATDTPRGAAALWGSSSLWAGTSSLRWRMEARRAAHAVTRCQGNGSVVFSPVAGLCRHHHLLRNIPVTPQKETPCPSGTSPAPQPLAATRGWRLSQLHLPASFLDSLFLVKVIRYEKASWFCVLDAVTKDMGARSGMGSLPSRDPGSCQRRDLHTDALGVLMDDMEAYPVALVCCLLRAQP